MEMIDVPERESFTILLIAQHEELIGLRQEPEAADSSGFQIGCLLDISHAEKFDGLIPESLPDFWVGREISGLFDEFKPPSPTIRDSWRESDKCRILPVTCDQLGKVSLVGLCDFI
jgi:hypothetical protein